MAEQENKKKSGLIKKVLKTTCLVGAGVAAGIAIAKPGETKNVLKTGCNKLTGFFGGLFKKKTAEPCSVDIADLNLAEAAHSEVRSNNNGWNNNSRPKFNNKH